MDFFPTTWMNDALNERPDWWYGGRGILGTAWIFVLEREAAEGFID